MKELFSGTNAYRIIENESRTGKLSHAYLIVYDDEVLLRDFLKEIALLIFPRNERSEKLIRGENFVDCRIYPPKDGKLSVDTVRDITDECYISPTEGEKKVFIISGAEDLAPIAQNKLLKVLEEPPENVHFILGATSDHSLLRTVLSRVKRLEVTPFSSEQALSYLKKRFPEKDGLEKIAATCDGNVGRAIKMIEGGDFDELYNKAMECISAKTYDDITAFSRSINNVKEKEELLKLVTMFYRDLLMAKLSPEKVVFERERMIAISENYTLSSLVKALSLLEEAAKKLKFNAVFPVLIEGVMLKIAEENGLWKK